MPSFLEKLLTFTDTVLANEKVVPKQSTREAGMLVMRDIHKNGYAVRNHFSDEEARNIFVNVQSSAERIQVDEVNASLKTKIPVKMAEERNASVAECPKDKTASPVSETQGPDEPMRKVHVNLQVAAEKIMTERLHVEKSLGKIAKSIWIIHTPVIATPCVTEGKPSPQLLANEIMQDETRRNLTLMRATIIRDYLRAGGVLIVAYNKAERQEILDDAKKVVQKGRTADQVAIFEKLKAEYPKQIIDFPMDLKAHQAKLKLSDQNYPIDMIGATYIMEDTTGDIFEMTNLGVQANEPRKEATWGVWTQIRSHEVPEVRKRMGKVMQFLQNAGLNQVLCEHAEHHKINPDQFAGLLSRYISLEIDFERGTGCKVQ